MSNILIVIVVLILLLPLLVLVGFKNIKKYLPGDIASKGTTGWLNFYGAYSGAILPLIVALIIFNNQRMDSVRPYIIVSRAELKGTYPEYVSYFLANENITVNTKTYKTNDTKRDERFFLIRVKNIGQGAALQISLYESTGRKAAVFNRRMNIFTSNDLTSLEIAGTFDFLFNFDLNKKYKISDNNPNVITEDLRFSYSDIYGNIYHQDVVFEYDRSTGHGGLGNRN